MFSNELCITFKHNKSTELINSLHEYAFFAGHFDEDAGRECDRAFKLTYGERSGSHNSRVCRIHIIHSVQGCI